MNQRERIELRKKKKQMMRLWRIFAAAGVIALLLIIFFIVKACTNNPPAPSQTPASEEALSSQKPLPSVAPGEINQAYFADSAFVGNSFVEGMQLYSFIGGADYFSRVGLNVNDAMTKTVINGTVPVIDELGRERRYSKIFMMFGENELGWVDTNSFVSQYGELIDKAKTYQPQSKIYLLAITPITKKASDEAVDGATNERILIYNDLIKQLAADKGAVYADIHSAVAGSDGALPEGAATDGIHFGEEYYKKCLLYIQNNAE